MAVQTEQDTARAATLSAALAPDGMLDLRRLTTYVPSAWASRATAGLDGVVRIQHPSREQGDLPGALREQLEILAPALTGQRLTGEEAVDAVEAAHRLTGQAAEARLHATRELAARTAEKALALRGVTSPDELSRTALTRWRARSKSVTAAEIRTLTGLGAGTAREVVAIATAPEAVTVPVQQGLAAGIAGWDLVLAWWRRCSDLPHEASALIARALFATDVPLEQVAHERLTPEGDLSDDPWPKKVFLDTLERLVRLHEDTPAQEKKREAQHASRDAFAFVDDDGTAQLVISGDAASVTACLERLQTIATRARAAGDPRTISALRSDTARALLLHGTLPMPDLGEDTHLITPDDIARLVDIVSGTPAHELQVIVPWDALTGRAALVSACPVTPDDTHHTGPVDPGPSDSEPSDARAQVSHDPPSTSPAGESQLSGVGRTLGRLSRFLTRAEIARIAGRPGTTLHRLLTDPADGRCLERSLTRYAPDAAMRAQLRAADVTSRAPGSTVPAARCDLDHVEEYLLGGRTVETNLQSVDRTWHALKTEQFWDAVMDETRTVTWESFWGRLYRTRPHDYRQYLAQPPPTAPAPSSSSVCPGGTASTPSQVGPDADAAPDEVQPHERRHLASLLVYTALAHRHPGDRLAAPDDDPDSDEAFLGLREAVWIRHTAADGRRRTGPAPGTPPPERLRALAARTVLDHPDWTMLGQDSDAESPSHDEESPSAESSDPPPPF